MLKKRNIILLFVALFSITALLLWQSVASSISSQDKVAKNASATTKKADVACDYLTPCEFTTELGMFWLTVDNPPIKAEQWIALNLHSQVDVWQVQEAKIVGKSMFMGRIPVQFKAHENGGFSAQTLVGACSSDKMVWQLQISVEIDGKTTMLLYDFVVNH